MRKSWQVWRDRRGRLSPLRLGALALLLLPLAIAAHAYATAGFGARPLNDLIHRTGYWALIFLGLSLAVTPLRRVARFGNLIDIRRMIGVGAFVYIATHLLLYVADQSYDLVKVASEIVKRLYLTIGFIAWLGLAVLAATSTDAIVRRLGGMNWRRLHQAIYVIGLLALTAGLLTFVGEAVGIGIAYRVSPWMVLRTAFDFSFEIRPGWLVLTAGLGVVLLDLVRGRMRPERAGRPQPVLDRVRA